MPNVLKTFLILLVILIATVLSGCSKTQPSSTTIAGQGAPPGVNQPNQLPIGAIPGQPENNRSSQAAVSKNVIRGSGTIDVANSANLNFGSAGQIKTINVKEGDKVLKGNELAKLDTLNLEAVLAAARVTLNQAKITQIQAESNLSAARLNLEKIEAVKNIQDGITTAKWELKIAQMQAEEARAHDSSYSAVDWSNTIISAQNILTRQENKLVDLLKNKDYAEYVYAYGQEYDRMVVEDAKIKALAVESAEQTLDNCQDLVDLAQKNLDIAQKQLDDATIKAPFDGSVAAVNQKVGDILGAPASLKDPVIYLIDTASLELVIGINELDMPAVKIGQVADVNIDAFPMSKINGTVSNISLVPTLSGSIVDYEVTITFSVPADMGVKKGMNATAVITAD